MKRAALTIAAVLAAWTLTAATVRTATEAFVTNRIALAMQSATNYTDSAIAFEAGAATNYADSVAQSAINYTDSTAASLRDAIAGKADATNIYTKAQMDAALTGKLDKSGGTMTGDLIISGANVYWAYGNDFMSPIVGPDGIGLRYRYAGTAYNLMFPGSPGDRAALLSDIPTKFSYAAITNAPWITSYTETDPVWTAEKSGYATTSALAAKADATNTYTKAQMDAALAGKADDADVVHTTGDETIAGNKTFSNTITANDGIVATVVSVYSTTPKVELADANTGYTCALKLDENGKWAIVSQDTDTYKLLIPESTNGTLALVEDISANNTTFSNAVLSVGLGIDPETIAEINDLVDSAHDIPISGATSVGALILALAAAIAALKKKFGYDTEDSAASATIALSTRTFPVVDATAKTSADTIAVTMPSSAADGKVSDMCLRIDTGASVPALTFDLSANVFIPASGDDAWGTLEASSHNIFSFTSSGTQTVAVTDAANGNAVTNVTKRVWTVGRVTAAIVAAETINES